MHMHIRNDSKIVEQMTEIKINAFELKKKKMLLLFGQCFVAKEF